MSPPLYHKEVFAPQRLFHSPGVLKLRYSVHAQNAAKNDRYGDLTPYLMQELNFDDVELVEVEVIDGAIVKRVVRTAITSTLSLVLVVQSDGLVRTVWGNLNKDKHNTLRTADFVKPQWNALVDLGY